jgi:hypothetical protein
VASAVADAIDGRVPELGPAELVSVLWLLAAASGGGGAADVADAVLRCSSGGGCAETAALGATSSLCAAAGSVLSPSLEQVGASLAVVLERMHVEVEHRFALM